MSTVSTTVSAVAFKAVDVKLSILSERDLDALVTTVREGMLDLPKENAFVTEFLNQLQCI